MGKYRTTSPRLRVLLGDAADEDTWTELRVATIGRDMEAASEQLGRQGLGPTGGLTAIGAHPIHAQAMIAYFALRRTGQLEPGITWPQFHDMYLEVTDDNTAAADVNTPTPPGPGPG